MKPILKWAGGKRKLLDRILPLISPCNRYIEPFLGGGAVAFALAPARAVLSDCNAELINVYETIRDQPECLLRELQSHLQKNSEEHYYSVRSLDRGKDFSLLPAAKRAARFIYLNKTCFNGLHRVNRKGQNNVPYGRYENPDIVQEQHILALHDYFTRNDVDIRCADFSACMEEAVPSDFVYLDPPYVPISGNSFTSYACNGFTMEDQQRLADTCTKLNHRGVPFIQSNAYAPAVMALYSGFRMIVVEAGRSINSNGMGRGKVREVLVLSDNITVPGWLSEDIIRIAS